MEPVYVLDSVAGFPDNGYIKIYSNERAFAALKADGSITTWGNSGSTLIEPSALRAAKALLVE
jgi:hypothetical protein